MTNCFYNRQRRTFLHLSGKSHFKVQSATGTSYNPN